MRKLFISVGGKAFFIFVQTKIDLNNNYFTPNYNNHLIIS